MSRRRFVALISLCMLVVLGVIGVTIGLVATRSERGQAGLRRWVEGRVRSAIHGRVHIGKVSGNFLTGLTIDSLEIRDDEDSLFVATGRVTLQYDPRDLVDRRLHFRRLEVEHPTVVLRQHENWSWNFKRIFATNGKQDTPLGPERGFGDYVIIDSAHIRRASFRVTIPWHPDDSLGGSRRDSAIAANLANGDHEVRRTSEGLTQTYRWTHAYAAVPYMRIAHPDSAGKLFVIDTLHANETVPPFNWRNVRGVALLRGDSVWMNATHFDLPRSTGRAKGKVWWGSDLPVRYAVRVWGDSVSLSDVAWVYPTLPRTGGGRMILDIRNERNLHQLDYALSEMDIRTTKSHIRGGMTFETGGPVLAVHDVKLQADPVDWDLLRTLNGKPFPADWQGTLTGTVTARGGPLTHFYVDAADVTFHDAHVPGAVSRVQGRGELDILLPAYTAFHRFNASTDRLDLRTLTAIYPAFPKLGGIVKGRAVLDSSWLDVRVSNAELTHIDGPAEPSHATGSGRVTYGERFMSYDLDLQASPLSLTTVARSYPKMPLRGTMSGPVRVRGAAPDLQVEADLTGAAGHVVYAGRVDADSLGGYGARGAGSFDALQAATLLGRTTPSSRLAGTFDVDLLGDSLANLAGALGVRLTRSEMDGVRVSAATSRLRFERGILRVDTLLGTGTPGSLRASGAIGLTRPAGRDSLVLALDVDSLGGLRRYLRPGAPVLTSDGQLARSDSLRGTLALRGTLRGWLDSLVLHGTANGEEIVFGGAHARSARGTIDLSSVRGRPRGTISMRADSVLAGGIRVLGTTFGATIADRGRAGFTADANLGEGTTVHAGGAWRALGDTTTMRIDTLDLAIRGSRWTLRQPMTMQQSPLGVYVDTIVLANGGGARLAGFARVPASSTASVHLRAESIPLADIGAFAQLKTSLTGTLDADYSAAGPRSTPTMSLAATARRVKYAALDAEALTVSGSYAGERAMLQGRLLARGRSVFDASVDYPVALTLFSARSTGDSLRGRVHADSVDVATIAALIPSVRNAAGRLAVDLALSGQPSHPHVGGRISMRGGALEVADAGLRVAGIDGAILVDAARDSITVDGLRWTSPVNGGTGALSGSLVFRDLGNPTVNLRLDTRSLRAIDKRNLARLDISTGPEGVTLVGSPAEATMRGAVLVDRGTIYVPEVVRKQLEDLSTDDYASLFDTTDVRNRSLMPKTPGRLMEHLRLDGVSVNIGDDVWLKSKEANIKLGGALQVTRARDDRDAGRTLLAAAGDDTARYTLALSGSLNADRGTYLLDLLAVQREFQVQSGKITFFGTPEFNPQIDVTALYRVKQTNRADIGVQARIFGFFYPQPTLDLTSSDASIPKSDLVSYLMTGRPSAELSESQATGTQRAMEFLLPTFGAIGSRALRDQFGSFMNLFQIQSGAVSDAPGGAATQNQQVSQQFTSFLSSTRLGGEKQISDRLFLSFSTGLCQLPGIGQDQTGGIRGFSEAIEGKLEYRFPLASPERLSIRAGREPAASALRCGKNDGVRGFVSTPQQWGLSLFRSWSF